MAFNVTKFFPATVSITNLPRLASRRRLDAVTPPPGKASSAALSRRSGVFPSIFLRDVRAVRGGMSPSPPFFGAVNFHLQHCFAEQCDNRGVKRTVIRGRDLSQQFMLGLGHSNHNWNNGCFCHSCNWCNRLARGNRLVRLLALSTELLHRQFDMIESNSLFFTMTYNR